MNGDTSAHQLLAYLSGCTTAYVQLDHASHLSPIEVQMVSRVGR